MGLIKTAVKVGVASSVHGRVQRRQQQRWAAQDQAAATQATQPGSVAQPPAPAAMTAAPPAPHPPQPAPTLSTAEKIAQLKGLGELRDSGVLTDVEFEIEKRKLLEG